MAKIPVPIPFIDTLDHFHTHKATLLSTQPQNTDMLVMIDFLEQYSHNQATFEAYRREIERLFQWSLLIAEKSILSLKREDIQTYIQFCLNPPKSWISTARVNRFIDKGGERIPNPLWRPFVATLSKQQFKNGEKPDKEAYALSQKAIREIFTILGSFYQYLILEEKVTMNPVALIKQKSRFLQQQQNHAPVMRLSEKQWQTCLDVAKKMAESDPKRHERTLFIMTALYLLYLRISELVASDRWVPQMGHFYQDSWENWWFKTVGKGNKMRSIAVSDDMLAALMRYRTALGLVPLPLANESYPLIPKEKGLGGMTSGRQIRRIVQQCFDKAIDQLKQANLKMEADNLEVATVHWLRHTGISDDINKRGRPVAHVRDDAGHSSIAITDRYNDIELNERYYSAKDKKREET